MPPQTCGSRTAPGSSRTPTPTAAEALPNRDLPRRLVHPFNVDAEGIFKIQQLRAVLAPLAGDNGPHVEVVVESGGGQVALGVDAVQIKMRKGPRAAVIVHDGKRRAGYRVGAAQTLGQPLAERGLASAQTARERDQRPGRQRFGKLTANGDGFLPRMGHK